MHKCHGALSLFPRVNETSSAALCFFFFFLKGEWLYWDHTTEPGVHITQVSAAICMMVGIAGGLLSLEPREPSVIAELYSRD